MKSALNFRKTFSVCLLLVLFILQTGCSINARDYTWSTYKGRDSSIDKWPMLEPRSQRTLLLATYASTDYSNPNKIRSDAELVSGDTPVLLAWIEFKHEEQLIPLYRYIIIPLKSITAEELLTQGKYIANSTLTSRSLPAKTPKKVTNGALVTDWQYCYDCITARPLEKLNAANIAYIREEVKKMMQRKPFNHLYFINDPKQAPSLKSRSSITVYSGNEALQQQELFANYIAEQAEMIAEAKQYDEAYRHFTETEHKPLTFSYRAEQAGCPSEIANPREIHGDRRSQSNTIIKLNKRYIECNSKVLENYDLAPYAAAYESLYTREKTLWQRSSKPERYIVRRPNDTINNIINNIDRAAQAIESAYDELDLADRLDARNRQLDVYSQQMWSNTLNNIQARTSTIQARLQQTQNIIHNAKTLQPKTTKPTRSSFENKPSSNAKLERSHSASSTKASSTSVKASTASTAKTQPTTNNTKSQPTSKPANDATEKQNKYVGSARDHKFTGSSQAYYLRELSEDLAKTNLMNQASKFCGSGLKTEILWSDQPYCKLSASGKDNYKCSIDALVNCYENFCDEAFCGTAK